ncbi:hypothetical protein D3C81_1772160 [compost metagenome]
MAHEAADDQVQAADGLQLVMQVGAGEGVGHALVHHHLAGQRGEFGEELAALALRVEHAAVDAQMVHVDDRRAVVARAVQQQADLRHGGFDAGQGQHTATVFLLGIDDYQGALTQGRRRVAATGDLQQAEREGHGWTPDITIQSLWSVTRLL